MQTAFFFVCFGMGSMQLWPFLEIFVFATSARYRFSKSLILKNTVKTMSPFTGCKSSFFLRWKGAEFSHICIVSLNPGGS